jgi:hypothetical protein
LARERPAQTTERATRLAEFEQSQPETAGRLRSMLAQTQATDTALLLPQLPTLESDDVVARAGARIGPYQLIEGINRGGMGSVWLAERVDGAFKRRVRGRRCARSPASTRFKRTGGTTRTSPAPRVSLCRR